MTQQTLNRCSNELPNDFRAKLQNPSNFDILAFGGSLRTNCPTPCKHPNDNNKKNENSEFTNNKKATHPSLEIHGRSLKDNQQHLAETSSTDEK